MDSEKKLSGYFTNFQWLLFTVIIITGIFLRWAELDVRPYHHDESQHAMFGKYFYDFPDIQFYKYDPMMHAPLLYNSMRLVYTALGNTLWSARTPIALIGTLFLFVPLLFRHFFSPRALLALTAAISLSSSMVYWSRFLIHDYFVLLSMIITLYGIIQARAEQKSFFVLLGLTLQFCIKANVFVTIAMIAGYLVYELLLNYFTTVNFKAFGLKYRAYFLKYLFIFFIAASLLTVLVHFCISKLDGSNKLWRAFIDFSNNTPVFILFNFGLCLLVYTLIFLTSESSENYLKKIYFHLKSYRYQFASAFVASCLVFCYIFSSGFRNIKGILDGLFRTSIPYWLNQHDIERIKGPFLFNFYMFAWYEFAFLIFLIVHLYLFYRNSPKWVKTAGISMSALALILSVCTLYYINPDKPGSGWHYLEEIGNKKISELTSSLDILMTSFVHFFKLKDCLDVIGLVLLLIHPLIVTTAHILKGEKVLAFWGYWFTASFFTYSFLGEKVPWLSMYPLVAGFIYLTLYFDDYFKKNPIQDCESYSVEKLFKKISVLILFFSLFFVAENIISISGILSDPDISRLFRFFAIQSLVDNFKIIKDGVWDNLLLFIIGIVLYGLYYTNRWTNILGKINLVNLIFVFTSLFCLRGAILTNFVYGGSETEFISQVHTTKEFHELAVRLRTEALSNIKPATFKILGDGDPVWPLTWYMVGVNEFKFIASAEERKDFDVIIQTYDENPKNVPEGFEKRRINLRGWWVPDYNQMTLKKFLNVSVNHIPWSPSGFTYAWLFINKNKA